MSVPVATQRQAADWCELSLEPGGRSLIGASAGTGKTWTIGVLYLRLLLEREWSPRQIVVSTFTEAAAAELRERIRARVEQALREAATTADVPPADADPGLVWLHGRWAEPALRTVDADRLRLALAELDLAPIGTLHGLCRRILADFPFDCGGSFEAAELVDGAALREELLDDLWRRLGQGGSLDPADELLWRLGRARLNGYLALALAPGVHVAVPEVGRSAKALGKTRTRRIRSWLEGASFRRSSSKLRSGLQALLERIDDASAELDLPKLRATLDEPLEKHLKPETIADPQTAEVLEFAAEAAEALERRETAALAQALHDTAAQLREIAARRLAASGQQSFDGLLESVAAALASPGGELAERLWRAWPVALVDEFQDTDGLQYGILDRIYRDPGGAPRGRLMMIGDAKQAIYRFRGGDIDVFVAAGKSADERLSLDVNHRSSPTLVAALNEWYATVGESFSTAGRAAIAYAAVESAPERQDLYTIDGRPCRKPLAIHYWEQPPEAADERRAAALDACARHIVALLSGGHRLGDAPLEPGNLAVLLPRNQDLHELRALLVERGVPCVLSARASVFATPWVRELRLMLYAALNPRDEGTIRAALGSFLGGLSLAELAALAEKPEPWRRRLETFHDYDALWRSRGVLALVQRWIGEATPRLLVRADAERALTDLRHLAELLQAAALSLPGREQLLGWLAGQGDAGEEAADEQQLRIESDARRVTLMTLHAAKGLEFDVVLLPLLWANAASGRSASAPVLHDAATGGRALRLDREAYAQHEREDQDERFRLLYVALTRARHACHVYALPPGRPKQKGAKSPAGDPARAPLDAMLDRLLHTNKKPKFTRVDWQPGAWSWEDQRWQPQSAADAAARAPRPEPAPVERAQRYSFSSLSRGRAAAESDEGAADDERAPLPDDSAPPPAASERAHPEIALLDDYAGTKFGNAIHAVLERRRLGQPLERQLELIERCIDEAHLEAPRAARGDWRRELAARLARRLQGVLDAEVLPGLHLDRLPAQAQRAEMGYQFVLDGVSMARLREAAPELVPETGFEPLRGMMSGKIDLVFEHAGRFHVLDWKSNRIGRAAPLSAYCADSLQAAMEQHHYPFQALLYTLAVERYLRARLPRYARDEQLGEALYLFVRATGIDARAPAAGIWRHRFDGALLDRVDAALAGALELDP